MVLVDTSVWIDHLRRGDAALASPARLWTRDQRLANVAGHLNLAFHP